MIDKTKPGLVALYDIQPWNAAGLFLQPRSPHGAYTAKMWQGEMSTSVLAMQSHPESHFLHITGVHEEMYSNKYTNTH